ncbi:juvenile hormone esterase-like [Tribolium castaneum]|uniref:juvenile hormone esterase-like n=1 Tax=Tribolium castaneum TaxID=7070 RepID=UPI00046C15EF|nr:PREDICTED: esterase FE4 [Tribolium castaneum]|eukprot:XP_967916.2 PREDICTED: esterase FE4 [Tribolium castaneum]
MLKPSSNIFHRKVIAQFTTRFHKMTLVKIDQGELIGTISKDLDGNNFCSFRGIPYAKPPLGKLRFKAPQPAQPWQGIFPATENGNCCYSKNLFSKKMLGSEDCLNLNVYTPKIQETDLLPVMVYIHGGGFTSGSNSSQIYGPEFLITGNVVLVTINYRLGLLGFLSLEDKSVGIPGNAGFKDMVMALKWVQKNIKHFGGDARNVTIFGTSAGGAAVHFLMLSPMSQGLFHKVVMQSGCALNPWSRGRNCDREISDFFGKKTGGELLERLQNVPVEVILQVQEKIGFGLAPSKKKAWGLVIDHGDGAFMPQEPLEIITLKKFQTLPLMVGFAKCEGMVVETYKPARITPMLQNFENNIPHFLGIEPGSDKSEALAKKIKQKYFGNEEIPGKNHKFYEMVGDNLFVYGIYSTVKKHSLVSDAPIYFYRMSLETSLTFFQIKQAKRGAIHCDDIPYLFKTVFTPSLSSLERNFVKKFVQWWTNFARFGNPERNTWRSVNKTEMWILDIDKKPTLHEKLVHETLPFWDKIYSESPSGQKFV